MTNRDRAAAGFCAFVVFGFFLAMGILHNAPIAIAISGCMVLPTFTIGLVGYMNRNKCHVIKGGSECKLPVEHDGPHKANYAVIEEMEF